MIMITMYNGDFVMLETDALVLREKTISENDKMLSILTPEMGRVTAFAKGAKSLRSHMAGACRTFCYGHFVLNERSDAYSVSSAEPIMSFHELESDLVRLALANYFAEAAGYIALDSGDSAEILQLMLNCLYVLTKKNVSVQTVKMVFELRAMCILGYMPAVEGCMACGETESAVWYFDGDEGGILCRDCHEQEQYGSRIALPASAVQALKYIISADAKKIFSFTLGEGAMKAVTKAVEDFFVQGVDTELKTLDFYKKTLI